MASPQVEDSPDGPIATPNENDVLCGRGGSINSHKVREQIGMSLVQEGKGKYAHAWNLMLLHHINLDHRRAMSSFVNSLRNVKGSI